MNQEMVLPPHSIKGKRLKFCSQIGGVLTQTIYFIFYCSRSIFRYTLLSEEKLIIKDDYIKHMEKMDLGFSGFQMELKAKKKNQSSRLILDGSIRGRARPGRMLAIMGPSGKSCSC